MKGLALPRHEKGRVENVPDPTPHRFSRIPPGQYVTEKFPVLTYGGTPKVDFNTWELKVTGLVEHPLRLTWEQFNSLPRVGVTADFHCVTQWSRLSNEWEGVPAKDVLMMAQPRPGALFVLVKCYGDYTTNLELAALMENDVLLATRLDGRELPPDHGGPLRLVVPKRYGWKSAKWVQELELTDREVLGFWEQRGYHREGDPWREERFSD
ncbi:MAG: sulfite oxidase-like oxidoreductase [Chloroflexi bacterium]|nr:sulfite oxidase-like oxidoreductase [Chloroflexota bacterium]